MSLMSKHGAIERNVSLLMGGTLVVVLIGGIVEIVPLFYVKNTIEKVDGMRPYSPLELAGRNIYIREGCYVCHSQMIRPFRDEVERYGHYSLAAESMYDHPFQWGSKRTGPDLARVGGRYSDDWHVAHLKDPQSVVPDSIMPSYAFLATLCPAGDRFRRRRRCRTLSRCPAAGLRRQPRGDGDGCDHRLSPDARNAGRFLDL
jgi:cytochrome c oxidase cbb3-type subunit 2